MNDTKLGHINYFKFPHGVRFGAPRALYSSFCGHGASHSFSCKYGMGLEMEMQSPRQPWHYQFFMKLFRTSDMPVVAYCREMFQFDLPCAILKKRSEKFDSVSLN